MSLPNLRLAAARVYVPRRVRRQAIEELFARTAAAFGSPVPPPRGRGTASRLTEYAHFTRERAEEALGRSAADGAPESLAALERRLYRAARGLGGRLRLRFGVRSPAEALAAARVIYRGLGIDFRASLDGEIVIGRCSFASIYTPRVCALVSALDRGLLAGLSGGGELAFAQRLTEGACCCRARFKAGGGQPARPRAIVVGSGAGGAAAARELQGTCQVTVLEAGREFRPLGLSLRWMQRLRNWGLLVDERLIRLVFPAMRVRKSAGGLVHVNGSGTGGTTTLSAGTALRMDAALRELGIDLDQEFEELAKEVPVSTAHRKSWSEPTRRLFGLCEEAGLQPRPTPKMIDFDRCRRCGRCVLGCPHGAKWDSRRFLDDAQANGARLVTGCSVRRVVIRGGRAIGVRARVGGRSVFFPADLVVLSAGGLGTPAILERSGIRCQARLFVDPVLCVAAPWPGSRQHHEVPMPFVVQRPGYIISPYFDYLSFLFNRRWRRPADGVLALMIKLADSESGRVPARGARLDKRLTVEDRRRLAEAEALCRGILVRFGVSPADIFLGTLNAGHPGGMLPLTAADAATLHPARLPANLYVADATLLPRSLGNPPILTILALARRVARAAMAAMSKGEAAGRPAA
jgi:NADPH-dependent 2,4-dienoyl-CoA reductase/sulfur reductase-like enzyme